MARIDAALLTAVLGAALPAAAQELRFDTGPVEACLAAAEPGQQDACIGGAAAACMAAPGGDTTVGMGVCLGFERDWWASRLAAAQAALAAQDRAQDAEMAELGASVPPLAPPLDAMQRAFAAFRDAACAYEHATWGNGTGGGPAHAGCMMELTARQALRLEAYLNR